MWQNPLCEWSLSHQQPYGVGTRVPAGHPAEERGVRSMAIRDMGVKQIERAIAQLPASELAELVSWLEDDHAQVWDTYIEQDLDAGRLDSVLAEFME